MRRPVLALPVLLAACGLAAASPPPALAAGPQVRATNLTVKQLEPLRPYPGYDARTVCAKARITAVVRFAQAPRQADIRYRYRRPVVAKLHPTDAARRRWTRTFTGLTCGSARTKRTTPGLLFGYASFHRGTMDVPRDTALQWFEGLTQGF